MKKFLFVFLLLVVVVLAFWGVEYYRQGTANDAAVIQSYRVIGTEASLKQTTNLKTTAEIVTGPLGVIAPLPNIVTAETTVQTGKQNTYNYDQTVQTGVSTQNSGRNCGCTCPYATKIVILGKGSTADSPEAKWFSENVRGSTIYPLDGGLAARINQIKAQIKKTQGDKCPQPKILIIGYSLGGSVAKNLKSEFPCVDVITIDPPSSGWCNFFLARWVSPALRQICSSENVDANGNVNWTDGNSGDTGNHYPWGNPSANVQKLKDLKATLDGVKCQP